MNKYFVCTREGIVSRKKGKYMDELMLSICVPTFNHENYIRQTLDSILMQKTNYTYEVLVGEDCSTDSTRDVLKAYEKEHPGRITVFYREHNMRNDIIKNSIDLKKRARGKYTISMEGDDFWTDPYKIQKQIDFLEKHPEYIAVSHRCVIVDENSKVTGELYPECEYEEYNLKYYVSEIMPGQLATLMYRNPEVSIDFDTEVIYKGLLPTDRMIYFTLASYGKIFCMQEVMSAYRVVRHKGTSFSATMKYDFQQKEEWHHELCKYAEKIQNKQAFQYARILYAGHILIGIRKKICSKKEAMGLLKKEKCNMRILLLYIKYWINHHILHKRIWI